MSDESQSIPPKEVIRVTPPVGPLSALLYNRDKVAAGSAGKLGAQDLAALHGRGLSVGYTLVAGLPRYHGTVADEAAMLALHVDSAETPTPNWVVPGDTCTRADLGPGYVCRCITYGGRTAADWEVLARKEAIDALAASLEGGVAGAQPLDADLTAIAAQGVSAFGLAWLALTGATAAKNALSLVLADLGDLGAAQRARLLALVGSNPTAAGIALLRLEAADAPKLPLVNADGSVSLIDVPSGGTGGGGMVWRAVTGDAIAAAGGEGIVATGAVAQSIACDLLVGAVDQLSVDGLGTAALSLTLGGVSMYSVARPVKLWARRQGDHLLVSRLPSAEIAPSYLASIAGAGLVADVDTMYMPGAAGDAVTVVPATVGAGWTTTAGSPVVRVIGGRKGVYYGSGARATAGVTPGEAYTIALAASSNNTGDYARTLAGRATNWLIGPYAGTWCFYAGSFTNFRAVVANSLMVIVVSRNTSGTHMHWLAADGSVSSASRGADYLPGIVDSGDIRGGENSWSTVFEVGVWSQDYDANACIAMVQSLSTRWAFTS